MEVFVATAREKQLLQWMLSNLRNQRQNAPLRGVEETPDNAPDVYIARIREEGSGTQALTIPALQRDYVDGTGSGSGTGPGVEDVPGSAFCDLYRIVVVDGIPRFNKVREREVVYNITDTEVLDDWFTVVRTKFGQWVAMVSGGGVSCESLKSIGGGPTDGVYSFMAVDSNGNCRWVSAIECEEEAGTGSA